MSLWELSACVDGWNRANGGDDGKPQPMSVARLREIAPPATIH
jgi:hypothetical protein